MKSKNFLAFLITVMVLITAVELTAEESDSQNQKNYSSSSSFSLLLSSGNTQEMTAGLDTEQNLTVKKNHFQLKGNVIYGRSDGKKNSELYYSHLKVDRELSSRLFLIALSRFQRNVLAGYNHRLSLSAGAGYSWLKKDSIEANSEATIGWSHENNLGQDASTESFLSVHVASSLKVMLSPASFFSIQELFSLNLKEPKDFRVSSLVSVTADISKSLALKFSYQLFYNHVPVPGFKDMDHYIMSSLVLNL